MSEVLIEFPPFDDLVANPVKRRLILFAAVLLIAAIVLSFLRQMVVWVRRTRPRVTNDRSLIIDLAELPTAGAGTSRLTIYHLPVRLAVLIIAPLGRDSEAPTHSEVSELLDHMVPGLASVLSQHQTIVKIWPAQLSATGFGPSLARHVHLPGDRGRGSPWCLVAGRTTFAGASYAVALSLAAESPNNLGLVNVETEQQWLDLIRLRN